MATEKLKFKLELYATMWDKPPIADIKINEKSYFKEEIASTKDKPTIIEFEQELEEGKSYNLIIDRLGKGKRQTIVENEKIIKDQLLNIKSIEIDEIDLGSLIYDGVYKPNYPEPWATQQAEAGNKLPETLKNVTQMGHNGTWTLTFTSPFYMWLLENLY
ncbi:MAG: hypothetical protein H8D84_01315 [Proteobacteria bacterium]|nr:hypothetical protein [Pseudomonadota bacterium]